MSFIPATKLLVYPGARVELLGEDGVRVLPGNQGLVLYGPYIPVRAGVYRITPRARVTDPAARSHFDIAAETRMAASRFYQTSPSIYAHLYSAAELEFRFTVTGEEVEIEGIEFEPLLLDAESAPADVLRVLAARLVNEAGEANAVFRLLNRLAEVDRAAAEQLRQAFLERQPRRTAGVRAAFLQLNAPGAPPLSPEARGPHAREDIDSFLQAQPPTIFDLLHLPAEHKESLRKLGYHPNFLHATRLQRAYDEPPRSWRQGPDPTIEAREFASRPPLFERFAEIDRSFQWEIATGQGMSAYCPVSGRLVRSSHGFCQHYGTVPFVIYRFEGAEVFYVGTGHSSNARLFIYMPRGGVLADLRDPWLRFFDITHVLSFFLTNLLSFPPEVRSYLDGPTRLAALVGNNTYGHKIWTTLTGLQFAAENGLLEKVEEVVELDNYFFPVQPLFPELTGKPTTRFRNGQEAAAFAHCLERRLLPVHFTDALITPSFIERVRERVPLQAAGAGVPPADAPRPLIYLNLRAHNKIWTNQGAGYAAILNAVRERYGAASAFLDGMPDCAAIAAEIRAATQPDIPLWPGLDLSFYDKTNWALACDSYVCPVGSSLALVQWLADKPGVAHAEHAHLEQLQWLDDVRPGVTSPSAPDVSDVHERGEGIYCDYDLDWRLLFDLLRPILDRQFEARPLSAA